MRTTIETGGIPGFSYFPHIAAIRIDGPFNARVPERHAEPRQDLCLPSSEYRSRKTACAKKILLPHSRGMHIGVPTTPEDVALLMSFLRPGPKRRGLRQRYSACRASVILANPEFIFRKEYVPDNVAVGKVYRISDLELASRLVVLLVEQYSRR
jgi:hypothetical protein